MNLLSRHHSVLWLLVLLFLATPAFAAIDAYEFQNPAQEQRFRTLTTELRCPKCQNQTIADSNAPLSQDLRQRVYEMIQAGRSDQEIKDFMITRYGDFITYRPPLRPATWILWLGPVVLVLLAALGLWLWLRQRERQPAPELSEAERRRLAELLSSPEDRR
ncbi:MAG TPA: cytochrome c-type biogenesis protein [Candidatus Competibacteraceae bacterium]|nr:cytochrome c-type biogenesis protein [Candidatus Competibacteraceae bacterium]